MLSIPDFNETQSLFHKNLKNVKGYEIANYKNENKSEQVSSQKIDIKLYINQIYQVNKKHLKSQFSIRLKDK